MCADPKSRRRGPAGFTLIESVVFIVIVGVGLAGVLTVLNLTSQKSADPMLMKQSLAIGEAFIDEILARDFADTCGCASTQAQRPNFVGVSDYNSYTSAGIYTRTGSPITGLTQYSVNISVAATGAQIPSSGTPNVPAGQMKVITVTVTDPSGNTYPITAYKANY